MFWPLLLLLPIIVFILIIGFAPFLLASPKEVSRKLKEKRNLIRQARSEETILVAHCILRQLPSMLSYNQFCIRGEQVVSFKKTCLYINIFGINKYALFYKNIKSIRVENARTTPRYSLALIIMLKDSGHCSLELRLENDEEKIEKIERLIYTYIYEGND